MNYNIAVVEKKDGQGMFVSMPSQKTGDVDEFNNSINKDICNPITAVFQQEFCGAILEAYELRKAGKLDKDGLTVGENEGAPRFSVRVTPFERDGSNIRGFASIYLEDCFVVSSVSIVSGRNGETRGGRIVMASSKEYLDFVLEQLSELDDISYRAMMGEYIIYFRGKVIGGIYDDRFLVKNIKAAADLMPEVILELPYDGAKEMLLVDDIENKGFLKKLLEAMYEELPKPKKRK